MQSLNPVAPSLPDRKALQELGLLQETVRNLASRRATALRMLIIGRTTFTLDGQRELWAEFSHNHEAYQTAVHRLARFCAHYAPELSRASRDARAY